MPLRKITIEPQHVTSLHPLAWTAEIEGTDHTLAGRKRHVDAATYKELDALIKAAHHEMFPQDEPLEPLEAALNHVDESIATEGERVEALVEAALAVTEGHDVTTTAEQVAAEVLEEHAAEMEELFHDDEPAVEDDSSEQPVRRRPRGRPRK